MAEVLAVSMAGGTIRSHRKLIHRESSRVSVLNLSGNHAVLQSIAEKKCLLTRPSLLSRGTLRVTVSCLIEKKLDRDGEPCGKTRNVPCLPPARVGDKPCQAQRGWKPL